MRQMIVGTYEFGYEKVQIVLREDNGAEVYFLPDGIDCPRIRIGADQPDWRSLVALLLHEAEEFSLIRAGARYHPSENLARDHAAYIFILNHTQLSQVCAQIAELLITCLPDLSKAWAKWKKETKK